MKVKLIDVLNMIEDKTLKDDERVIIDSSLYYYSVKDKKFYIVPKSESQNIYRKIYRTITTDKLDFECELIDRNVIELNVKEIGLTLPKTSTKKNRRINSCNQWRSRKVNN